MPTAFDPDQAVSAGILGATGPVKVTFGPCSIDYFDYTNKAGQVVARTLAALITMSPEGEVDTEGKQRSYQQVYSIGDIKTHSPNIEKTSFDGPLVKGSNFNFLLEHLINAGFPKHLIKPGDIRVLNGMVAIVEQKSPPKREIKGATDQGQANKAVAVPTKILSPAPNEEWPATGKAYPVAGSAGVPAAGATKQAAGPKKPAAQPSAPASTAPAAVDGDVTPLAEAVVKHLIAEAGVNGFTAKGMDGTLGDIGKKANLFYMKAMQKDSANFPPNSRAAVIKLLQTEEFLFGAERPWVGDQETGLLVAS